MLRDASSPSAALPWYKTSDPIVTYDERRHKYPTVTGLQRFYLTQSPRMVIFSHSWEKETPECGKTNDRVGIRIHELCKWRFPDPLKHQGAAVSCKRCHAGPNFIFFPPERHQHLLRASKILMAEKTAVSCFVRGVESFSSLLKFQNALIFCLLFLGISRKVAHIDDQTVR